MSVSGDQYEPGPVDPAAGYAVPVYPPAGYYPPPPRRRRVWLWISLGAVAAGLVGGAVWGAVAEIHSENASTSGAPGGGDSVIAGGHKVVTASDQKCQLTEPADWVYMTAFRHPEATIQERDPTRERYVGVFGSPTEAFKDLGAYEAAVSDHTRGTLDDPKVGDRQELTVGSLPAVRFT